MTEHEFKAWLADFRSTFPFYEVDPTNEMSRTLKQGEKRVTPGRVQKLWRLFSGFTIYAATDGLRSFDQNCPDLNGRNFSLSDLLKHCFGAAEQAQQTSTWTLADESAFWSDAWQRRRLGVDEITIADFALYTLGKPRVPTYEERGKAAAALKTLGAKTPREIERQQQENSRNYAKFCAASEAAQAEMKQRNYRRGSQDQEPKDAKTFAQRGRELVERIATS